MTNGGAVLDMPKAKRTTKQPDSRTVRISVTAYEVLSELAGMRHVDLGDCASDLLVRHGSREVEEEARKILSRRKN